MSGTWPNFYSYWPKLSWIVLSGNRFVGTLNDTLLHGPPFKNLSNLGSIFAGDSPGIAGTLPSDWVLQMPSLTYLNLSDNGGVIGTLPVVYHTWRVQSFTLCGNRLEGTLPPEYSAWGDVMTSFNVRDNNLSGSLPASYANWTRLQFFIIANNSLGGSLHPQYNKWTPLTIFRVAYNYITGSLPADYADWMSISEVALQNNQLSGTLPAEYGQRRSGNGWIRSLLFFTLMNNLFTGSIPSSWSNFSVCQSIMLQVNRLSGTLPMEFGMLPRLNYLNLAGNNLSGTLPESWSSLSNILMIALQNNPRLTGTVPTSWNHMFDNNNAMKLMSICNTALCGDRLPSMALYGYLCLPTTRLADSDVASLIPVATMFPSGVSCDSIHPPLTSTTTSLVMANDDVNDPTVDAADNTRGSLYQGVASTTVVLAAVGGLFSASGTADMQMLAAVLDAPCSCTRSDKGVEDSTSSYTMSPFVHLGPAAMAFGNTAIAVLVLLLHWIVVHAIKKNKKAPRTSTSPTSMRQLLNRLCLIVRYAFPKIPVRIAFLLTPGAVRGGVRVLAAGSESTSVLEWVGASVGLLGACACFILVEVVVYRQGVLTATASGSKKVKFAFLSPRSYKPIPATIARWTLPRGGYVTKAASGVPFMFLVSNFIDECKRLWPLVPLTNLMVQTLMTVGGTGASSPTSTTCDVLQSVVVVVTWTTSSVILWTNPHRTAASSWLTAASLFMVGLATIVSIMCRHGVVEDAGSTVIVTAVGATVGGIARVHSLTVFLVERWLGMKKLNMPNNNLDMRVALRLPIANNNSGEAQDRTPRSRQGVLKPSAVLPCFKVFKELDPRAALKSMVRAICEHSRSSPQQEQQQVYIKLNSHML